MKCRERPTSPLCTDLGIGSSLLVEELGRAPAGDHTLHVALLRLEEESHEDSAPHSRLFSDLLTADTRCLICGANGYESAAPNTPGNRISDRIVLYTRSPVAYPLVTAW